MAPWANSSDVSATHPVAAVTRARAATWLRQGAGRVRRAAGPTFVAAVACGLSHLAAMYIVGHPYPFFAPVAAWACLGFTAERSVRRAAETGLGLSFGIFAGEYFGLWFGHGPIQIGTAIFLAVMIARFVGSGATLASHSGTQTAVLVGMPAGLMSPALGGSFGRWSDAVVGSVVAVLVALLVPSDPRRHARASAQAACRELAHSLTLTAAGLRSGSATDQELAMSRARGSQLILDEWRTTSIESLNTARVVASARRFRSELAHIENARVLVDRAMRSVRVVARRVSYTPQSQATEQVAHLMDRMSEAVTELGTALAVGREPKVALRLLEDLGKTADPGALGETNWHAQSLILVLRSAIVDLAEASGASPQVARDMLPPL